MDLGHLLTAEAGDQVVEAFILGLVVQEPVVREGMEVTASSTHLAAAAAGQVLLELMGLEVQVVMVVLD